jgi:isopenicillin-N N-acyltransferase-like protein
VSTDPWQLGAYICYDLRKVFQPGFRPAAGSEIADTQYNIAADTLLLSSDFQRFLKFRQAKMRWMDKEPVRVGDFIENNPSYYDAYRLSGDFWMQRRQYSKARNAYEDALRHEIATEQERTAIQKKIDEAERLLRKK